MTKSELIALLAADPAVIGNHLTARDVDDAVNSILNAMTAALAQGSRIEIRGFGSFSLNYRPPRVGRNPKSGDTVEVPAKIVPHFKAGKEMRERVDKLAVDWVCLSPKRQQPPLPEAFWRAHARWGTRARGGRLFFRFRRNELF